MPKALPLAGKFAGVRLLAALASFNFYWIPKIAFSGLYNVYMCMYIYIYKVYRDI